MFPGRVTLRQRPKGSHCGDGETLCFSSTFWVSVGQLTQASLHRNFDHLFCLFLTIFPLRIPEAVIEHRNNSGSFFFGISVTLPGPGVFDSLHSWCASGVCSWCLAHKLCSAASAQGHFLLGPQTNSSTWEKCPSTSLWVIIPTAPQQQAPLGDPGPNCACLAAQARS